MVSLNLDLFSRAVDDVERTQYEVLAGLQQARRAFAETRIFPHLGQLIGLYRSLRTVLERTADFRTPERTPETGTITGIDWEKRTVTYEWPRLDDSEMRVVEDLIRWALPHVRDAIEEGRAVYDHVDDNMELETVGIVPSYLQEGYLMVPHGESDELYVLRYTLSIFRDEEETHRALRTVHCKTIEQKGVDVDPSSVKLDLLKERRDLPNPATYFSNTDMEVPYEETLLPIVKRRLVRRLASELGRA